MIFSAARYMATPVIDELILLLNKGNAHASFEDAVKGLHPDLLGKRPRGLPYSIWQLAEHIRLAQWDILEFCKGPHHKSPPWPEGFWPKDPAPDKSAGHAQGAAGRAHAAGPTASAAWPKCLARIASDKKEFIGLLREKKDDLFEPFPYGEGQTLFREALLIADHTAYHTGEIIVLRRLLGDWK